MNWGSRICNPLPYRLAIPSCINYIRLIYLGQVSIISYIEDVSYMTFEILMNQLACTLLFIATLAIWISFFWPRTHILVNGAQWSIQAAAVLLTILLLHRWWIVGHIPLSTLYESALCLSWTVSCLYILLKRDAWSLLALAPTSCLIQVFAVFSLSEVARTDSALVPALQSNWLMMHVSMMVLSYGLLITGAILALMWLIVDTSIITHPTHGLQGRFWMIRQSSILGQLDDWSYRCIGLGFPFLTLGIVSGAVWANEAWGTYWSWDPKETWAFLTWLIFAIYLHTRITRGWQGAASALVAALGLGVVWVCYLGVNLIGKGLHSYGWLSIAQILL